MKELEKQIAGADKFTLYEDVKNQTTEDYFHGNKFSIDAFKKKYALMDKDETYVQALKRVCDYIASVEKTEELRTYWSKRWFHEIYNDWWHPAGSIMQGAGSGRKISLANCTTTTLGTGRENEEWDSLEGIIKNAAYTVAKSAAYRQGTGIDFSRLRPRGTSVLNSANESTGSIHWMKFIDSIGNYVGQFGRTPAILISLSCKHPDIEEFIISKADRTKIQNANISVQCTDDFYEAARKDKNWDLEFEIPEIKKGQKVYIDVHSTDIDSKKDDKGWYYIARTSRKKEIIKKTIRAKDLMVLIAKNMHAHAEPGIQNIDIAKKYSNSDYLDDLDSACWSTNACCLIGESLVMTDRGEMSMQRIHEILNSNSKEEILVMSYNIVEKKYELKPVVAAWQKRNDSTVELKIEEDGKLYQIECSADHPIMTKNRGYIDAADLTEEDDIMMFLKTGKLLKIKISKEVKPLYDIEVEDNHNFIANGIVVKNSEQYLGRENLCILSSINCGKFSIVQEQMEKEMAIVSPSINRFLDNVNECEIHYGTHATPHQRMSIEKLRRTGAGMTNIAGWLFKQNVSYASKESVDLMEKYAERYAYYLYKSSIALGKEKGSFGLFDREKLEKAPFIKRMMKLGLEFNALRNITLISIAPTGSLSLMMRDTVMSYGIEPAFGIYYWKRTRMSGKYEYYFNVPNVVREFYKSKGFEIPMNSDSIRDDWDGSKGKKIAEFIDAHRKEVGINFKGSMDVKCSDKLELMARIMKWVDSSISVTYMLPEDSTWKDVYEFIMEAHEKEVKSISAFPDRKMYGIISFIPFKSLATKLIDEGMTIHPSNFSKEEQAQLAMSDENIVLNTKSAPKRQEVLDADIYSITVNGEKFVIVIGKQNQYPYEIFGGKMKGINIEMDAKHIQGKIRKISRGVYSLEFEETVIKDFSKQFTPVEKVLFRSLSLMLRHGIPIEFIVDQLNKANDNMFSISAAITRVLKKYIKDGQKVSGSKCPKCGSEALFYNDGCVQCSCGWSACS